MGGCAQEHLVATIATSVVITGGGGVGGSAVLPVLYVSLAKIAYRKVHSLLSCRAFCLLLSDMDSVCINIAGDLLRVHIQVWQCIEVKVYFSTAITRVLSD